MLLRASKVREIERRALTAFQKWSWLPRLASAPRRQHQTMAAPQIPNLNTLRSGKGLRGRGRGGRSGPSGLSDRKNEDQDSIIQKTDSDASHSRLSAVEVGYLEDPFAKLFVTEQVNRRFPIINRGKSM